MLDLKSYLNRFLNVCRDVFGDRLVYVGLQGSQLRGEANAQSDIDLMVVIDRFTVQDMDVYRSILIRLGNADKSCGFLCGKDELKRWNRLEVFQLLHTTKDLYGTLSALLPEATRADEIEYVRLSLGNLYHELCHRYVHADRELNVQKFRGSCKYLLFLVQNLHYLESGTFVLKKRDLMEAVSAEDRNVLQLNELPDGYDFDSAFSMLFAWCQRAFDRIERIANTEG